MSLPEQIGRTLGKERGRMGGRGTKLGQLVLGKHLLSDKSMMVTWVLEALERGKGKMA